MQVPLRSPVSVPYKPAAHSVHAVTLLWVEYEPAVQETQPKAVVYEPGVQSEHQVHMPQTDEPGAACKDGPHGLHEVAPIEPTKVSVGQRVQPAAPGKSENDPAPQKKHVGEYLLPE